MKINDQSLQVVNLPALLQLRLSELYVQYIFIVQPDRFEQIHTHTHTRLSVLKQPASTEHSQIKIPPRTEREMRYPEAIKQRISLR